jgi:hypothetical protein
MEARSSFSAISGQIAVGQQHEQRQDDADKWQHAFKPSPFAIRLIVGRAQHEKNKPHIPHRLGMALARFCASNSRGRG